MKMNPSNMRNDLDPYGEENWDDEEVSKGTITIKILIPYDYPNMKKVYLTVNERLTILENRRLGKNPGYELGRSEDYYHSYCDNYDVPKIKYVK